MWVEMLANDYLGQSFSAGETYEVDEFSGYNLIRCGSAIEAVQPPNLETNFYARLSQHAGKPCVFLPFIGEFGHQIQYHARLVHWHKAKIKIVCCLKGYEVLYPSADGFMFDWTNPVDDSVRCGTGSAKTRWPQYEVMADRYHLIAAGGLTHRQELFIIGSRVPFRPKCRGLKVDVCIGTRARKFSEDKNWQHAHDIARWCEINGLTYCVIGTRQSSFPLEAMQYMTGDYGDVDAAIESLQNCRLFVGTDSGSAHLAAEVGCNMIVQGVRQWPGVRNFVKLRMQVVNPGKVTEIPEEHWDKPVATIDAMRAYFNKRAIQCPAESASI